VTFDPVSAETERIIRRSEVMAVLEALRTKRDLRVGSTLDYFIDVPAAEKTRGSQNKASKCYRLAVEQWHLDAAQLLLLGDAIARSECPFLDGWDDCGIQPSSKQCSS
jgi:hypothetical protein